MFERIKNPPNIVADLDDRMEGSKPWLNQPYDRRTIQPVAADASWMPCKFAYSQSNSWRGCVIIPLTGRWYHPWY